MAGDALTFLLTDIEGSTRLWESRPDAMRVINARHDALVDAVVGQHGGTVVRSRAEGDSAFIVFDDGGAPVAAAIELQEAMAAEPWPAGVEVRVRMAVHTGPVSTRAGEYYGPTVNRCVKLRAIAFGGQVVLSEASAAVAGASLPEGASLLDMGEHRLPDLARPEHVYQLLHPTLHRDFPPLKSVDAEQHNLVRPSSSFVARDLDAATLVKLVHAHRAVTVSGPGGVGKTRLTVEVGFDLVDDVGAVWRTELTELPPGAGVDAVAGAVARAVGVRDQPTRPPLDALVDHLRARTALLLLDNCEHVTDAVRAVVTAVLPAAPGVRMLATSRQPIGAAGEHVWRLPPMASPAGRQVEPADLNDFAATQLFLARAAAVAPDFAATPANAGAIAAVCAHLDGIPLAIELAAARLATMPVEAVLAGVRDQRAGGSGTGGAMQATIEWSHGLLAAGEQALLHRLGVFAGPFTIDAAEGICPDDEIDDVFVLDGLDRLVTTSLVDAVDGDGELRYRLLESVREFAGRGLGDGEAAVRSRHQGWFLHRAESQMAALYGPHANAAADIIEADHPNMVAAARWPGDGEEDARYRLAVALYPFWFLRGYWREGRSVIDAVLAAPVVRRGWRAYLLTAAGALAEHLGDYDTAVAHYEAERNLLQEIEDDMPAWAADLDPATYAARQAEFRFRRAFSALREAGIVAVRADAPRAVALVEEGLEAARAAGSGPTLSGAVLQAGGVYAVLGGTERARACFVEVLDLLGEQREGSDWAAAMANLGAVDWLEGEYSAAQARFDEARAAFHRAGDVRGEATALHGLADVALVLGRPEARELAEDSLALYREMGDEAGTARGLETLGSAHLLDGDVDGAEPLLAESLDRRRRSGDRAGMALTLLPVGDLHRTRGRPDAALACYDEARAIVAGLLDPVAVARVDVSRAGALLDSGVAASFGEAAGALAAAAAVLAERPHPVVVAGYLGAAARLAAAGGDTAGAAWLAAASASVRLGVGGRPARPWQPEPETATAGIDVDVTNITAVLARARRILRF